VPWAARCRALPPPRAASWLPGKQRGIEEARTRHEEHHFRRDEEQHAIARCSEPLAYVTGMGLGDHITHT